MSNSFYFKPSVSIPTVRKYKGMPVPWVVHDCTDSNSCRFCKKQKVKFAHQIKAASQQEGR